MDKYSERGVQNFPHFEAYVFNDYSFICFSLFALVIFVVAETGYLLFYCLQSMLVKEVLVQLAGCNHIESSRCVLYFQCSGRSIHTMFYFLHILLVFTCHICWQLRSVLIHFVCRSSFCCELMIISKS